MNKPDPQKLMFTKVSRVSRYEFDRDPSAFSALTSDNMREALAHHIQNAKIEMRYGAEVVEGRLELYAATPAEFWALVNYEAERIANRFGMTLVEQPARKPTHWFVKFNNKRTCYVSTQAEAESIEKCLDVNESITPLYE